MQSGSPQVRHLPKQKINHDSESNGVNQLDQRDDKKREHSQKSQATGAHQKFDLANAYRLLITAYVRSNISSASKQKRKESKISLD